MRRKAGNVGKKKNARDERIRARLQEEIPPVQPDDAITEAGRKVLRGEFARMLSHEAGSRTGENIEDVHQMRVAIRQMRSGLALLEDYFEPGVARAWRKDLRRIMRALGPVRDLDVMIHDLNAFDAPLNEVQAAALRDVLDSLDQRRMVARQNLIDLLDSKFYRRFVKGYADFLTTPGAGVRSRDRNSVVPYQVRHVLPPLIYQHVAAVRAYEPVLDGAEPATMHALRIEFKRLRYVVALFADVLGKDAAGFINELKNIQDLLGRMNDIEVARQSLVDLMDDLDGDQNAVLWVYIEALESEKPGLYEKFPAVWQRFNSKAIQRKLAVAVAAL